LLDDGWRTKMGDLLTEAVKHYHASMVANGG
jgi:N-acetylmuramoyl-L-alanine amidase